MNSEETTNSAQAAQSSPAKAAEQVARAKEEKPHKAPAAARQSDPEELNANVRVAKESSTRKLISFVMGRLERGGTVTLQALNLCVHKAITIALIVRDRLGEIHQVNSLLVVQETKEAEKTEAGTEATVRTTSGIQIILSKSPLD